MSKVSNINLYGSSTDNTKRLHLFSDGSSQKITAANTLDVVATGAVTIETKGHLVFKKLDSSGNEVAANTITDVVGEISTARVVNSTNSTALTNHSTLAATALTTHATNAATSLSDYSTLVSTSLTNYSTLAATNLTNTNTSLANTSTSLANTSTSLANTSTSLANTSTSLATLVAGANVNLDTLQEIVDAYRLEDTNIIDTIVSLTNIVNTAFGTNVAVLTQSVLT